MAFEPLPHVHEDDPHWEELVDDGYYDSVQFFLSEYDLTWEQYCDEIQTLSEPELIQQHPVWKCFMPIKQNLLDGSLKVAIYQNEMIIEHHSMIEFEHLTRKHVIPKLQKKLKCCANVINDLNMNNFNPKSRHQRLKLRKTIDNITESLSHLNTIVFETKKLFSAELVESKQKQNEIIQKMPQSIDLNHNNNNCEYEPCIVEMTNSLRQSISLLINPVNVDKIKQIKIANGDNVANGIDINLNVSISEDIVAPSLRIVRQLIPIGFNDICNDTSLIDSILYFGNTNFDINAAQNNFDRFDQSNQRNCMLILKELIPKITLKQKIDLCHNGVITTTLNYIAAKENEMNNHNHNHHHRHRLNLDIINYRDPLRLSTLKMLCTLVNCIADEFERQIALKAAKTRYQTKENIEIYTSTFMLESFKQELDTSIETNSAPKIPKIFMEIVNGSNDSNRDCKVKDENDEYDEYDEINDTNDDFLHFGYFLGKNQLYLLHRIESYCLLSKESLQQMKINNFGHGQEIHDQDFLRFFNLVGHSFYEEMYNQAIDDIQKALKYVKCIRHAAKKLSYKPLKRANCNKCHPFLVKYFDCDVALCFCLVPIHLAFRAPNHSSKRRCVFHGYLQNKKKQDIENKKEIDVETLPQTHFLSQITLYLKNANSQ